MMATTMIPERNRSVIDALVNCVEACNACGYNCCADIAGLAECSRLCTDCAAICELTFTLLSRNSRWTADVARIAAQISAECATECEKFEDEYCRQCVPACQASAERCRELAER